jgi:hypothetical protein
MLELTPRQRIEPSGTWQISYPIASTKTSGGKWVPHRLPRTVRYQRYHIEYLATWKEEWLQATTVTECSTKPQDIISSDNEVRTNHSHNQQKKKNKNKLHGPSPQANYTDRATAACRRSECQLLRIRVPRGQRDGSLRPYSQFSRQEPLPFYQVAPQLYSRSWVGPVPDPLLFFGSAGNRTRASGSEAKNSDHKTKEAVLLNQHCP